MLAALALPVLIGLFLVAMERFESRVLGPYAHGAGGASNQPATGSVAPSVAQIHRAQHHGDEADIDRQGSGRSIEGRGPWTCR
jgi:hypothetical protein